MIHEKTRALVRQVPDRKIIFLVLDGLGGLPHPETRRSELETADIPNLDRLAARSSCGRAQIVDPGVTPGSGPGHLALFGYPPLEIEFGRGALEALGSDFDLQSGDLAARANFATVDDEGIVHDRRAGRPSDEENRRLCARLSAGFADGVDGVRVFVLPGKEHRFTVVFRGADLAPQLNDNDPQREGRPLLDIRPQQPQATRSAEVVGDFLRRAREILRDEPVANGMLLRGFSGLPNLMPFKQRYGLTAGVIAAYPMYRGVARLVGMDVLGEPKDWEAELALLEEKLPEYDFIYIHYKGTDTAGHSGDFTEKVEHFQIVDATIPRILTLRPEVLVITGDHSTPCIHKEHSWHPVPTLIHSPLALPQNHAVFTEIGAAGGDLGTFPATHLLPLALAHASHLDKFGA